MVGKAGGGIENGVPTIGNPIFLSPALSSSVQPHYYACFPVTSWVWAPGWYLAGKEHKGLSGENCYKLLLCVALS